MHDAAIPPYGHLVESELKATASGFSHEKRVEELVRGGKEFSRELHRNYSWESSSGIRNIK